MDHLQTALRIKHHLQTDLYYVFLKGLWHPVESPGHALRKEKILGALWLLSWFRGHEGQGWPPGANLQLRPLLSSPSGNGDALSEPESEQATGSAPLWWAAQLGTDIWWVRGLSCSCVGGYAHTHPSNRGPNGKAARARAPPDYGPRVLCTGFHSSSPRPQRGRPSFRSPL